MAGKPTSKGNIDPLFLKQLEELREHTDKQATAAISSDARVWQIPTDQTTDMRNIAGLKTGFDRDTIGQNFSSLIEDGGSPGTAGDVVAVKTQSDYVAMLERAYRARHAGVIRCLAHAAARRKGHGNSAGIFSDTSGVNQFVADTLRAGKSDTGYEGKEIA